MCHTRIILLFAFILGLFLSQLAYGAEPEWIRRAPKNDSTYKYYVGRSSLAPTEADAFQEASRDAFEQAIRENFGFYTKIQNQSYTTPSRVTSTKRIQDLSRKVHLSGFEQVEFHNVAVGSRYNTWVLYRYKQSAIAKEKGRLRRTKESDEPRFSEAGNPLDRHLGTLEVVTRPAGANLFIDGVPVNFMETPLRLFGKIPLGRHSIKIDHPHYEIEEQTFIVAPGKTTRIFKVLKRAMGELSLVTTPSSAQVRINGKSYGRTPLRSLLLPAGEVHRLAFFHPEAERVEREIRVTRGMDAEVEVPLPLKPAKIQLSSSPKGAAVSIDGSRFERLTPTGWVELSAGYHSIEVSKDGFETVSLDKTLRGGERLAVPQVQLRESLPIEVSHASPYEEEVTTEETYDLTPVGDEVMDFSILYASSSFEGVDPGSWGFAVGYVNRMYRHLGFEIEGNLRGHNFINDPLFGDEHFSYYSFGAKVGLPISVYVPRSGGKLEFRISPEWSFNKTNFKVQQDGSGDESTSSSTQQSYGGSFMWGSWKSQTNGSSLGWYLELSYHKPYKTTGGLHGKSHMFLNLGILGEWM